MTKKKKESFFWTSYSDLMTSLFFVILVLFVLSLVVVKNNISKTIEINEDLARAKEDLETAQKDLEQQNKELDKALAQAKATIEQQNRILKIDKQFKPLEESGMFKYYPNNKKFVAKDFLGVEIFNPNSSNILNKYRSKTISIGKEIEKQLKTLYVSSPDFKYQLVIEGNVANTYDKKYPRDGKEGYKLSYERALAVYQLWHQNGIDLRKYNTEILICGSGWNGLDRDPIEEYNKRFSVQIIPKISSPKN